MTARDGKPAGHIELSFSLARDKDSQRERIQRVERSPLAVFFPTVLETHLGFLVQGPYRTTPSRDNVPRSDTWNQHLVGQTASLLGEALCWLRDNELLDTAGLRCLPLDPAKFGASSMFAPLYDATKSALSSQPLLPRFDAGHVATPCARLGRTQELRDLFMPAQLAALYREQDELVWLSGDITQDRTPELRRYLMQELDVQELTPEAVIPQLDRGFLETQSDDWIGKLYEFLSGQPGLRRRFEVFPLIRLEDGTHVPPRVDGQPQAFLAGPIATGFPVVRATVCASETSLDFLRSLGLTQPDPVDDVVRNVLPKYRQDEVDVSDADYEADIGRILNAFGTDSKGQRKKLLAALRESAFVKAVHAGDKSTTVSEPGDVYLATERLKELFAGVDGILLVDDAYACLRGEDIRELLEACGATRSLQPVSVECHLSSEQRTEIRRDQGLERSTWEQPIGRQDTSWAGCTVAPAAERRTGRTATKGSTAVGGPRGCREPSGLPNVRSRVHMELFAQNGNGRVRRRLRQTTPRKGMGPRCRRQPAYPGAGRVRHARLEAEPVPPLPRFASSRRSSINSPRRWGSILGRWTS